MRKANQQNRFPVPDPQVRIRTQNFLTDPDRRVDLIVTSPPYSTMRKSISFRDVAALRIDFVRCKNMLGNQYGIDPPELAAIKALSPTAEETYRGLLHEDRRAHSPVTFSTWTKRLSVDASGGMAVFVIGNTRQDRQRETLGTMKRADFFSVETIPRKVSLKNLTPYRDARGRFTRDSTQRKVYGEEFVVIGRKR